MILAGAFSGKNVCKKHLKHKPSKNKLIQQTELVGQVTCEREKH